MTRSTILAVLLAAAAPAQEKIKVLIVDGQNNHNYKAMTPFMKAQLEKAGYAVDVSTSPPAAPRAAKNETPEQKTEREKKSAELKPQWDSWRPKFADYKVVVSNYNGEKWPDEVNRAFESFVSEGGGFLPVHAANNAFTGWKEYEKMVGLLWRDAKLGDRVFYSDSGELQRAKAGEGPGAGHGSQHEFKVVIRDAEHPITKGLPKEWMHAQDELYHGQRGPAENMRILASAFNDKAKGGTGVHEPMLWIIPYGKGQVVTNVLGHENGKSLQCVGFVTLLNRSVEWLATGKVTTPVPADFPTAEKTSLLK
jgi:type 1 glutamine amidotransferase